ncbi:hypothetical protein N3K66_005314 [Trichothecium roseum]|uniref:Uncharacterized protein n=1 Tax=Trichothecium roseum TaxID=47278 RepID=A0ACC0UXJ0_9HYPO|nr:hypothetical protein N3K66_005314 [Trichothecium roseum]
MQRMYELWATAPTNGEGIRGGVHMYALDDDNKLQDMLIRHAAPLKLSATPSQSRNYRGTLVSGDCQGLSIHREQATLRQSEMGIFNRFHPGEYFTEKAAYVHCNILMTPYSPYNAIVLSDDRKWSHSDFVSFKNGSAITAGRRTLGVAHFLMLIQLIYRDIEAEWQSTMSSVGREIGVSLSDVNDNWVARHFMNDESFDNSKKYLRLLQVFRIMGEWIVQNMRALETLREDFFREITGVGYDEAEVDLMKRNWAIVMEDAQHRTAVI